MNIYQTRDQSNLFWAKHLAEKQSIITESDLLNETKQLTQLIKIKCKE